jgi:6-phosphogluconolactonase
MPPKNTISVFANEAELSLKLNELIESTAEDAIQSRGKFCIALSGGSMASVLSAKLSSFKDISKWHFFYADERCVPLNSAESNHFGYKEMYRVLNVPKENIHTIHPDLIHDPPKAAVEYAEQISQIVGIGVPVFDMILLGMGPGMAF